MFKKSKKVISIFLTLLFTITICPLEALAQTVSETKTYLVSTQSNQKYKKIAEKYEKYMSEANEGNEYLKDNNILSLELTKLQSEYIEFTNSSVSVEEDVILEGSSEDAESIYDVITTPVEQWNLDMIGADGLNSPNDNNIKIAVIDTGVCASGDIPIAGRINLVPGEENVEPLYEDVSGHGTGVASIIGAADDNRSVKGVNSNAQLYSVKALNDGMCSPVSRIIEGIYWCIDNDINIINMSFGTHSDSELLHNAVRDAYNAGILMIAAAGNDGNNSNVEYPAAYEEVMAVGSVDNNGIISDFSATGEEIEIVAPGENIAATGFFDEVVCTQGTSVSAAQVTGAASLLWEADTTKSADFVRGLLTDSAKSLGNENEYGYGIVDVSYALEHYNEYAQNYTDTNVDSQENILYNDDEVETYTDSEIKALWTQNQHASALDQSGITYSSDKKILLKYAVKMSDHVLRGIINNAYGYPWDDTSSDAAVLANRPFHSVKEYNNYVANYIFIANCAYYYKNNGNMPQTEAAWQSLFPKSTTANISYDIFGFNECDRIKNGLTILNANWSSVYTCLAADGLASGLSKPINASTGHNSLILIGIAIHCAMDAYEHLVKNINGVNLNDDPTDTTKSTRLTIAKKVALSILKKWDAGAGSFQISEFYQPDFHPSGSFYMVNLLQNVVSVQPNLISISPEKYNFFYYRNYYYPY